MAHLGIIRYFDAAHGKNINWSQNQKHKLYC